MQTILIIHCDESAPELERLSFDRLGVEARHCHKQEALELPTTLSDPISGAVIEMTRYQPSFAPVIRTICMKLHPKPVVVLAAEIEVPQAICCMKLGARDVKLKPLDADAIMKALSQEPAEVPVEHSPVEKRSLWSDPYGVFDPLPIMERLVHQIRHLAPLDIPVLIVGEAGSGKHAVAMQLHQMSQRAETPVMTISMRGREEEAVVKDIRAIFGEALSARQVASGGATLLLDSIEGLSDGTQRSLLALLAHRVVDNGGSGTPPLRVLATTTMDLREETHAGRLKPELYQRLATLTVAVPSLRERGPDSVRTLARRFHERARIKSGEGPRTISERALDSLSLLPWPGNVPQLREVVEAAFLRSIGSDSLDKEHIDCALTDLGLQSTEPCQAVVNDWRLRTLERRHIEMVLATTHQNRAQAARMLGITRTTLYKKIAEFGLDGH